MTEIMKHINSAREWLDRAENRLRSANRVESELFLSLAEAEIHKAWENSLADRKPNQEEKGIMSNLREIKPVKILLVASLLFLLVFGGYNYLQRGQNSSPSLELTYPREVERSERLGLVNVDLTIAEQNNN